MAVAYASFNLAKGVDRWLEEGRRVPGAERKKHLGWLVFNLILVAWIVIILYLSPGALLGEGEGVNVFAHATAFLIAFFGIQVVNWARPSPPSGE